MVYVIIHIANTPT